jgi:aconitate hydratase
VFALGDDISTDEIMPAGRALNLRSNIPALARFAFARIDESFHPRAMELRDSTGHIVVGGDNYGQGSSRGTARWCPHFSACVPSLARAFAHIHGQNLVNFGVAPLLFCDPADHDTIEPGDMLRIEGLHDALLTSRPIAVVNATRDHRFQVRHDLSDRQVRIVLAGRLINDFRNSVTPG